MGWLLERNARSRCRILRLQQGVGLGLLLVVVLRYIRL